MQETDSIIKAGVFLAVYEFLMLIMYFFLSKPIPTIINGVMNTEIVPELATYGNLGLTIFNIMFAVAFLIPVIYFLIWCIREDPQNIVFRRY